jgi:capsular exopolysaccharide synthesis family protein
MQEPTVVHSKPENHSTTHIVHVLLQFAVAVRHRKHVLIAAIVVAGLLGGLYYATATRYYAARASLLVLHSGSDITETAITPEGNRNQGLMPTYESLVGEAKVIDEALKALARASIAHPEYRIDLVDVPEEKWGEVLRSNLSARTRPNTNIIRIEYHSKDPGAAVTVVNALLESYLKFIKNTHQGAASDTLEVLEAQAAEVARELQQAETALAKAREEVGVFADGDDSSLPHPDVQEAMSFHEQWLEKKKELTDLEGTLAAVDDAVRRGVSLDQFVWDVEEVVGKEFLLAQLGLSHDGAHRAALERQWLDLTADLKELERHFGPAYTPYQDTLGRIREIEGYLSNYETMVSQRLADIQRDKLGPLLLGMLNRKLQITRFRERALYDQWLQAHNDAAKITGQLSDVKSLEHTIQGLLATKDGLGNKINDVRLKHEGAEMKATVVSPPTRVDQPVSPSLRRVVLMALIVGLGTGLLAVYVLDILDDRFRSVEEMQTQLGAPVLAMVRQLKAKSYTGLESLQLYSNPDAVESEAFRTLRTALSLTDQPAERMVISSAEPGDGKTTILANLAVSCAQSEKRTLLLDADLRRPGLTAMLELRAAEGLSSIIRGSGNVAEMAAEHIRASGIEDLDVLPSGPRPSNPAELLSSPRFADLLGWAETVYDRILIDSPPALAASDTAVIGRLVDGVVLVVQPDKNRRRMVTRAAETLTGLKISLLGIVINRVDSEKDAGYYGYDRGYEYDYGAEREPHADGDPQPVDSAVGVLQSPDPLIENEASPPGGMVPRRRVA